MYIPDYSVLRELVLAPSVSGHEDRVREKIIETISSYVDEIKTDKLGNIIALKKGLCGKNL
ncbi:MAG TPA: hypothetical protein ENI59_01105, partial [Euryarchaeota archaeon]|nr:hypothetical protein [Euryarchaeota archaeon]